MGPEMMRRASLLLALVALLLTPLGVSASPRIWADVKSLQGEATWVEISWDGIPLNSTARNDVVAIYADAEAEVDDLPGQSDPVYYILPFIADAAAWMLGKGSYRFYVVNIRQDLVATYLRGRSMRSATVLTSVRLQQATPDIPMHPHLAPTNDPTSMRVVWYTRSRGSPFVKWGMQPGRYSSRAAGAVSTFTAQELCRPPANTTGFLDPHSINSAVMTNLRPGTRYYYQVGDLQLAPFSQTYSFITAPSAGRGRRPGRPYQASAALASSSSGNYSSGWHGGHHHPCNSIGTAHSDYYRSGRDKPSSAGCRPDKNEPPLLLLAWADHGAFNKDNSHWVPGTFGDAIAQVFGEPQPGISKSFVFAIMAYFEVAPANAAWQTTNALAQEAKKDIYHAAALNGDIAYAFGNINRYDNWLHLNKDIITRMPLLVSAGNHESDDPLLPEPAFPAGTDSGGECGIPYAKRLQPPSVAPQSAQWYSLNMGLVHFLQLSTEQAFWPGSTQYEFIVRDLQSVDRQATPWVIAGFHRPMYADDPDLSSPAGMVNVSALLRQHLEPLFVKHQVDLTITGHIHWYHRTCPIIKGNCVGLNADGTAKAPVHLVVGNAGGLGNWITFQEQPPWFASANHDIGYSTLNVTRTRLTIKSFASDSPTLITSGVLPQTDELTLRKPLGWKPDPVAADALYKSTPEVPLPPSTYSSTAMQQLMAAKIPSLAGNPANLPLLVACFGPTTATFKLANAQEVWLGVAGQLWEPNASLLTFLKATYAPGAQDPASWAQALDYAYTTVVTGRWSGLGVLPPGCKA